MLPKGLAKLRTHVRDGLAWTQSDELAGSDSDLHTPRALILCVSTLQATSTSEAAYLR